jgi:hypothetical protein
MDPSNFWGPKETQQFTQYLERGQHGLIPLGRSRFKYFLRVDEKVTTYKMTIGMAMRTTFL